MALHLLAPAKINLYLHVTGRREDGYHLLESLVAFADVGDRLTAEPAPDLTLTVTGPEAEALADLGDDNLVLRAARLLAKAAEVHDGARLHLVKNLPAASGIGGGSSDAAATLHLLSLMWNCAFDEGALMALAATLGADVPACIAARPVWVGGIGETIEPAGPLPPAGIVLANPRRPLATPAVFRARQGRFTEPAGPWRLPDGAAELAASLAEQRNDLTEAALTFEPQIETVLQRLSGLPKALLARMSGSGATCFALFASRADAMVSGGLLAESRPEWWVAAGELLTKPPAVETAGGTRVP